MSQDLLNINPPPLPNTEHASPPPLPTGTTSDKEAARAQDKIAKMVEAGKLYTNVAEAQAFLDEAEKRAADFVSAEIVKAHGLGPHKIRVGGKDQIVVFQRVSKTIRAKFLDLTSLS